MKKLQLKPIHQELKTELPKSIILYNVKYKILPKK